MILSFYSKDFDRLQNNATLVVEKKDFKLVKRPIELNDFSCVCEAFTEDVQPTFIVVQDNIGRGVVYSSLAGVPVLNESNQTEINGTDLKTLFSSDVVLDYSTYSYIGQVINYIFEEWDNQVNNGSISCRLVYNDDAQIVELSNLQPTTGKNVYNALEEIQAYLSAYNLYIDSEIDLVKKEVVFTIGKTMNPNKQQNIKLWEYGIRNYGKWVADVNETQGYDKNYNKGIRWILTSQNEITIDDTNRDIFPIKKRIIVNDDINEANKEALIELLNSRYNENLELPANNIIANFDTTFNIYIKQGNEKYKSLPCGELRYNSSSFYVENGVLVRKPYEIQLGYRYVGVDFI